MTLKLIECPVCHAKNPSTVSVCPRCSTPISASNPAGAKASDALAETLVPDEQTPVDDLSAGELTDLSDAQGWSQPLAEGGRVSRAGRLAPNRMLGKRYQIVELLGEGGMGAVYQARDCELDRMVALKIIRPELALRQEILARFKQELILARRVTHKNVIRIFDLGEAEGLKFITMEMVDGKALSSLMRESGRLSYEHAADVIYQTCAALDAAHSEGVVHRDLKPQNIMIEKNGRVVVMDFGIARSLEQRGLTQTGAVIGTPDYMSPEQVMGQKVDGRSDLFTVGVIFFQLLVGQLPFKSDTLHGAMLKRTMETPPAPQAVDPEVPLLLSDVAVKCLQREPQLRYQSAVEIQRDIDAWRGGSTKRLELPAPPPPAEPAKTLWWKRTAVLVPAAALLAGGAVLVANRFIPRPSAKPTKAAAPLTSLAILPFHNASGNIKLDWLGSSMAEMLSTDVGQSASVRVVSEDRVEQVLKDLKVTPQSELDSNTIKQVANQSNADTVVWGRYEQMGDRIRVDGMVQDFKSGTSKTVNAEAANDKELLSTIDGLAAQIRQNLAVSSSLQKQLQAQAFKPSTTSIAALREYDQGMQDARNGNYSKATTHFESALHEDSTFALAYAKLSQAYAQIGQDDEAEAAARKGVSLSGQLPAQERYLIQANLNSIVKDFPMAIETYQNLVLVSPQNTEYLMGLGTAYENAGNYAKAKEMFTQVTTLDPKRIEGFRALGRATLESGDTQGGIDVLTKAQSLAVQLGDDAERALVLQAMGIGYYSIPRYEDALKSFEESLEIKRRLNMQKGIAESLDMMATIQDLTGHSDLALKNYTDALSIQRALGNKQGIGDVSLDLGAFQEEHGKFDQALKYYKESLQIQIETHNETNQSLVLNNIGGAYESKGDLDNARTYFTQALALREKLKVPKDIADTLHNLAEISTNTGKFDQALEQYLKALQLRRDSGDQKGAAIESSGMGVVFAYQGRYGAAIKSQKEALDQFQQTKEQDSTAVDILLSYGNALSLAGRNDEAAQYLANALDSAHELKNEPQAAKALSYQGDNAFYRGDLAVAQTLYAQAQSAASKTGDAQIILRTKVNLARMAIHQGRYGNALNALRNLREEADSLGLQYVSLECQVIRGEALIGTKDYKGAEKELNSAVVRSEKLGTRALQAQAHYNLGRALEVSSRSEEANTQYQDARRAADEVLKEAQTDAVTKRSDLAAIFALKT
jgi:serine/threonine protein kinase/Flp pilus assembly protein TadD